jgi:endonuclease III
VEEQSNGQLSSEPDPKALQGMISVTAADLGIDMEDPSGHGLYKWLLASFLIGKRIRSSVAVEAYRNLVDRNGLDTPDKLARRSHRDLVRYLGQAGYVRYDESTARRLHCLATRVSGELDSHLIALSNGGMDVSTFRRWLLGFEGVGPKTVEIFMREAAAVLERQSTKGSLR